MTYHDYEILSLLRDISILLVALWALWSEFSPNTKSTTLFSIARLLLGLGGVIVLSRYADSYSSWLLATLILILVIGIIRSKQ